jgi:type I restriction enzyme M protein
MNHREIVNFIWSVADLIRDSFKRGKYQDVILPLTVLRRLDCVLAPTKARVLEMNAKLRGKLENLEPQLRKASGFAFYNTISQLSEAGLLFQVLERFKNVDLHPDRVSNPMMGTIFEELIRKFNEALNENPGEHFTPRDVVHLMVDVLLAGDDKRIKKPGVVLTICDPCCGSGGMLTIAKDQIGEMNTAAEVHLFGQEVNPETFAVSKSDLFMKSSDGRDAENVLFGSTLSNDRHAERSFDYLIANPPYGKDWKRDEAAVKEEYARGTAGRFSAGLPRISDGQFLFLQHMLAHMKEPKDGGSRVAIIMNGSPLFTGDAGSGESEIRRWILENDWLEALIALPEQLFYNTGIATYVWVLTNRKAAERRNKVQLINATTFWTQMRRSLGNKRREIPTDKAREIVDLLRDFQESEFTKIFPTTHFGLRKVTVERPLRLNFQTTPERIARLTDETAFTALAISKKKDAKIKAAEELAGRAQQDAIRAMLATIPSDLHKSRDKFTTLFEDAVRKSSVRLSAALKKATLNALSERDESTEICRDSNGNPEPDPELRDTENVPLGESIQDYFDREVRPYVPAAWFNESVRDHKDGEIGKVGYEINFNRYFYKYQRARSQRSRATSKPLSRIF